MKPSSYLGKKKTQKNINTKVTNPCSIHIKEYKFYINTKVPLERKKSIDKLRNSKLSRTCSGSQSRYLYHLM